MVAVLLGERRLLLTWAALVAITLAAWGIAHDATTAVALGVPAVTLGVLVLTGVKVALVIDTFMEVREAPRWLRLATGAWVLIMVVSLVGLLTHGR